jgi:hypothetical protein
MPGISRRNSGVGLATMRSTRIPSSSPSIASTRRRPWKAFNGMVAYSSTPLMATFASAIPLLDRHWSRKRVAGEQPAQ